MRPLPPPAGTSHYIACMENRDTLFSRLNGRWHKRALQAFVLIVLAHWAEHLVQAYQVYVLKWPMHQARGVLGQAFPWLVHSEVLHYGYALIRSEEHTSELQSHSDLVCRLLLEKKKNQRTQ